MEQVRYHKVETLTYPVITGPNPLMELDLILRPYYENGIYILTDENTKTHCLPLILESAPRLAGSNVYSILPGEQSKNITDLYRIWKWLIEEGAGRKSLLINIGGGVVSDMGGFAAATYNRGMDYLNIPTSLIGQVDAAIGGKTGLNVDGIKNQAGLFYDPVAVIINHGFLNTLPESHIRSGWAEILKSAILSGGEFYEKLKGSSFPARIDLPEMILLAVQFKMGVVATDPFDRAGRKILNFGHTVGHILETLYLEKGREDYLHGSAVAAGMICESWMSFNVGRLSAEELLEIVNLSIRILDPVIISPGDYDRLLTLSTFDKKKGRGVVQMTIPGKIGGPMLDLLVDPDMLRASFDYYNSLIT